MDAQDVELIPTVLRFKFETELEDLPDSGRLKSFWRAAIKVINATKIRTEEWARRSAAIYSHFEKSAISPEYARKMIRLMNLWGKFYSSQTGIPYVAIKAPSGYAAGRILRAYRRERKCDKASEGLTPELLEEIRVSLSIQQYNWLLISLWFGLRPQEVDSLKRGPQYSFFGIDPKEKCEVLRVRQTKLVNLPEEDQWKSIPILYREQRRATKIIKEKAFEAPLPKTIKRYTRGNHHLYAGRKGFGPLMWGKGHDLVEVSNWLGHKSINRTFRDYMRWKGLMLRPSFPEGPKSGRPSASPSRFSVNQF